MLLHPRFSRFLSRAVLLCMLGFLLLPVQLLAAAGAAPELEPLAEEEADTVVEYVPIPVLGRTPELGWMFGLALFIVIQSNPVTPASTVAFNGIYTTTGAYAFSVVPQFYLLNEFLQLRAAAAWRSVPSEFYGVGREQRRHNYTDTFVEETRELSLNPMFRISEQGRLGPIVRVGSVEADDPKSTTRGRVSELESNQVPGLDTSSIVEFGTAMSWDSKEPVLDPYYGSSLELLAAVSNGNLGASFDYARVELNATRIQPVPVPLANHRVALNGVYEFTEGTAPFQVLPRLGGDTVLRGLAEGRYRDYHMAAAQVEYRFPLVWRFGAVLFGGVGQTAPDAQSFQANEWVFAGGAGLRFAVSTAQRLNIRVDLGYSDEDGVNVYIGAMEAF